VDAPLFRSFRPERILCQPSSYNSYSTTTCVLRLLLDVGSVVPIPQSYRVCIHSHSPVATSLYGFKRQVQIRTVLRLLDATWGTNVDFLCEFSSIQNIGALVRLQITATNKITSTSSSFKGGSSVRRPPTFLYLLVSLETSLECSLHCSTTGRSVLQIQLNLHIHILASGLAVVAWIQ
jgi:hypothetical protein